jgi:prevent-host-death family protein
MAILEGYMPAKIIGAAKFKAECLRVIDQMHKDHEPVTITKRGRPVAMLTPVETRAPQSIIGALRGSVLRYDQPFAPAVEPTDWDAAS